jgi:drug/metabolite transporter (DMT)-like permease
MSARGVPRWVFLWLGLVLVWGWAFVFIKVSLEGLTPLQVAFGRVSLGAVTVLVMLAIRRISLPRRASVWRNVAIVALAMNVIPFTLFAFAETHITSIVAGMANAATPLWALAFGFLVPPSDRIDISRLTGLAVGTVGVLVLMGVWQGGIGGTLLGAFAAVMATAGYGFGVTWTKRRLSHLSEPADSVVAAQLLSGSAILGVLVLLFSRHAPHFTLAVTAAIVCLGVFSTGFAFPMNYRVVRDAGALTSASTTYAIPIVSTIVGILVLGESLTWNEPVGAVIVLVGVALVQGFLKLPGDATRAGSSTSGEL